ncbi:MAG: methylmalonyl Co-A mutase-associated GTPase MeaB [Deinococcales bacterium]|nr:methylmalonyl Co-A mutase-associated GTPase MeaB [Deinococcales bacterium]
MEALRDSLLAGDERALARAISLVEAGSDAGQELLRGLRDRTGRAAVVGITGSPGAGKSTLTDALIAVLREHGRRVGVVAIDPTSPFSGGAILGDRIRMTRWHSDPGVFIRSMATRGHLGGLAAATLQVVALLDAVGFDHVLIETVGVGQSEVDVVQAADTTVVVLTPGQGDGVQAFKAGIMEIADVFCINKYDLPGADRLRREVAAALELGDHDAHTWFPPIVGTVAAKGEGVATLLEKVEEHLAHLGAEGRAASHRRRVRAEVTATLGEQVRRALAEREAEAVDRVLSGAATPGAVVRELLASLAAHGRADGHAEER